MSNPPATHAADRLLAAIESKRAPVCVGLDPVAERLPLSVGEMNRAGIPDMNPLVKYCVAVLDGVAPHVPCVKFQSACFERFRMPGVAALGWLIKYAHSLDLMVILDAKRGDIGVSAEHYAAAVFEPVGPESKDSVCDWVTINSYLGEDGITPFLRKGHGAFALVRTSNPGGDAIQDLELKDGRRVAEAVAQLIAKIGNAHRGKSGYSALGAVVGATKRQDASRLREWMPHQIFLVPGFGAQGGGVDDVLRCFNSDGHGAIVSASRSVTYAFERDDPKWMEAVGEAAARFADAIGSAVGMRR
ncbi:MAG: orotidine-5'-phosphate decarboxylase [Phycisphaerales bacterium]|nr:orotidine-5'-phosphate decarboxylase [Phycisphaerales bacterium]MCI0676595.1 orotidine-5'-phosphate decarboxylase [Phycisphaerales bacterium]